MTPKLRFDEKQIRDIAGRYEYQLGDNEMVKLAPAIKKRGCIAKDELHLIAKWKATRSARHTLENSEEDVKEITRFALAAKSERARIQSLLILHGVGWPMASVILHFFHRDPYPILDYRALWSSSLHEPTYYKFDLWWSYVQFCRKLAKGNSIDIRTLDRALWQYSKEKQDGA